jgi:dihydrodipicolinate synthase/N-acetylneuraminate lyase
MKWNGVLPAITTSFSTKLQVDHAFMGDHCRWLTDNGCSGIVALGSLGEGATLTIEEKLAILKNCATVVGSRVPVVAAISSLSTREAIELAKAAAGSGCEGLMVLPPYVYLGDWRETKAHVAAVIEATNLSCMLYNNPIAYGTDFLPEQIAELAAEHMNLHAVKESSTDARRVTGIKALLRDRLAILVGVDDALVEGVGVGATGWVAGLANAFPRESVELLKFALAGEREKAAELYYWFLPLLRMDTVPNFVQLIKLAQQEAGVGNARVRPPRLELTGAELDRALHVIRTAVKNRPAQSQSTRMEQASYARG